jgi:hypothetical protein
VSQVNHRSALAEKRCVVVLDEFCSPKGDTDGYIALVEGDDESVQDVCFGVELDIREAWFYGN